MADFGYDIADYRAVDPLFGTLDDFDRLLDRAHALGLKVMIDQVLSHTSIEHAWFQESRQDRTNAKADWYVWADPREDGTPPNNWLSLFGGVAWQWECGASSTTCITSWSISRTSISIMRRCSRQPWTMCGSGWIVE